MMSLSHPFLSLIFFFFLCLCPFSLPKGRWGTELKVKQKSKFFLCPFVLLSFSCFHLSLSAIYLKPSRKILEISAAGRGRLGSSFPFPRKAWSGVREFAHPRSAHTHPSVSHLIKFTPQTSFPPLTSSHRIFLLNQRLNIDGEAGGMLLEDIIKMCLLY